MTTVVSALPHLYGSVAQGFSPKQGTGFQTVAVAGELVGTDDLEVLERLALYVVSSERRQANAFPVKDCFYRLPSGRFAVGRTRNVGQDFMGRDGNYLTYHLVFSEADWHASGGNPFTALDALEPLMQSVDWSPRELLPITLTLTPAHEDESAFQDLSSDVLFALVAAAIDSSGKTILLIGDEAQSARWLRALISALPLEERLKLTFSTHFYDSAHLRPYFALVTVSQRNEAPSPLTEYTVFDFTQNTFPALSPKSAYTAWLADALYSMRWREIATFNAALNGLRHDDDYGVKRLYLPQDTRACAALWEKAGQKLVPALIGKPDTMLAFLRALSSPSVLLDALLTAASPAELIGPHADADAAETYVAQFRIMATPSVWKKWAAQWKDDPHLASLQKEPTSWWKRAFLRFPHRPE